MILNINPYLAILTKYHMVSEVGSSWWQSPAGWATVHSVEVMAESEPLC